jgi:hypothetical protein
VATTKKSSGTKKTAVKKTTAKKTASKKTAAKKSPAKKTAAKKSATKGRGKVEKVMHEYKHGELKSGGRKNVKNRKQAVAIALSEARRAGAKIPAKKGRKTAARKR